MLRQHQSGILSSNPYDWLRLTVRRKYVFEDTLHKLRNGIDLSKHLRVTFASELAIEDGSPLWEYLRLLLGAVVSNNSLFSGDINSRYLQHNVMSLNSVKRLTSMLVRNYQCHLFMDQLLTTFFMVWRGWKFVLRMYMIKWSRANCKRYIKVILIKLVLAFTYHCS